MLWGVRDPLGRALGLGRISAPGDGAGEAAPGRLPIPGTTEYSLVERLPDDLRATVAHHGHDDELFVPLYRIADEYAAELSLSVATRTCPAADNWFGRRPSLVAIEEAL